MDIRKIRCIFVPAKGNKNDFNTKKNTYIKTAKTMKTQIEYLPFGETAYHLDNGVTVYYYNEETPLLFKKGLQEIGRLLSTNTPYIDIIHFAAKVTAKDIENYFS